MAKLEKNFELVHANGGISSRRIAEIENMMHDEDDHAEHGCDDPMRAALESINEFQRITCHCAHAGNFMRDLEALDDVTIHIANGLKVAGQ